MVGRRPDSNVGKGGTVRKGAYRCRKPKKAEFLAAPFCAMELSYMVIQEISIASQFSPTNVLSCQYFFGSIKSARKMQPSFRRKRALIDRLLLQP